MSITWTIDQTARFAVMSVRDPFTIFDWRATMLAIFAAPVARPRMALLIDQRQAEPVTTVFVNEMSSFFERYRQPLVDSLIAIVVSDDAGFGMGRMTALQNPNVTIRVFRDYDAAVAWLTLKVGS